MTDAKSITSLLGKTIAGIRYAPNDSACGEPCRYDSLEFLDADGVVIMVAASAMIFPHALPSRAFDFSALGNEGVFAGEPTKSDDETIYFSKDAIARALGAGLSTSFNWQHIREASQRFVEHLSFLQFNDIVVASKFQAISAVRIYHGDRLDLDPLSIQSGDGITQWLFKAPDNTIISNLELREPELITKKE